jgi:nitrogen fixation protein NifU and related proteins
MSTAMNDPLEDLYKEVILDHYRHPRHGGELPAPPAVRADGYNPLCGDEVTVFLDLVNGTLRDIRISGRGCSISQASASMMSEAVAGRETAEVREIIERFKDMMHAHSEHLDEGVRPDPDTIGSEMGDLEVLKGVVKFPVRIKCATLPWVTLQQGLTDAESGPTGSTKATTEDPSE